MHHPVTFVGPRTTKKVFATGASLWGYERVLPASPDSWRSGLSTTVPLQLFTFSPRQARGRAGDTKRSEILSPPSSRPGRAECAETTARWGQWRGAPFHGFQVSRARTDIDLDLSLGGQGGVQDEMPVKWLVFGFSHSLVLIILSSVVLEGPCIGLAVHS